MSRFVPVMAAVSTVAFLVIAPEASAQSRIGFGPSGFLETGRLDIHEAEGESALDDGIDYRNTDSAGVRLLYLRPYDDVLDIGAGIGFDGVYGAELLESSSHLQQDRYFEFGPLFDLFTTAEWRLAVGERSEIGVGGRLGISAVYPTGDLSDEIAGLRRRDIHVWNLPRFGWTFESVAVNSWRLGPGWRLRTEAAIQWQTLSLFNTEQTRHETTFQRHWTTGSLRGRISLLIVYEL